MKAELKSVRKRLLGPLIFVLLLIVSSFLVALLLLQKFYVHQSSEELLVSASSSFEKTVEAQTQLLVELQKSILEDSQNALLLGNDDREELYAKNFPIYKHANRTHDVTHYYFHQLSGINLLRVHDLERHGDPIKRESLAQAKKTQQTSYGLELGPLGTFTLRVVTPVLLEQKIVGYHELGKEIEDVMQTIEHLNQVVALVYIDKSLLKESEWKRGMQLLGRNHNWNLLNEHVLTYRSKDSSWELTQFTYQFSKSFDFRENKQFDLQGEFWQAIKLPLSDMSGNAVGKLLILKNITPQRKTENIIILLSSIIVAVLMVSLIVFLSRVLRRVDEGIVVQQQHIIKSRDELDEAQHIAKIGSWQLDHATQTLKWSKQVFEIFEVEATDSKLTYNDFIAHVHPDDKESVARAYSLSLENRSDYHLNHRIALPDGKIKHVHERCETSFDKLGKPIESKGTIQDITELVIIEEALHEQERQKRDLLDNTTAVIYIKDLEGRYTFVNKKYEELFHVTNDNVIGKTDFDIFPREMANEFRDNDLRVIDSGKTLETEEVAPHDDGNHTYFSVKFPMKNLNGDVYATCGISTDITERKIAEEKVVHQAHYDALTDLPNRFLVLDRLSQLLKESKRQKDLVGVVFLDLDDFKKINDTLGHEFGDKLLIEASERLRLVVREGDTVGRLGGDEFIVLLQGINESTDARPVVETLLNEFREPFEIDGRELILTTTVGIAIYPNDGETPSELLRNADSAMYHAKEAGRNTYSYFTQSMNRGVARRLSLEEQIHGALERKEFHVVYQTQISTADESVFGCEALLRWDNPVLGSVSPNEFIPIAEQTGEIIRLGKYVITQAMRLSKDWHLRSGEFLRIAVNLSPAQFRDPELIPFIKRQLDTFCLPASYLELEITEGVLMSGHSYIDEAIEALSLLGITLSMDDFGTGYSSLSYLRHYPFNVLKIDRSFIRDINVDEADKELVSAAIAMAHGLGLSVIAEGVETLEQFNMLKTMRCDYVQGLYFSVPIDGQKMLQGLGGTIQSASN